MAGIFVVGKARVGMKDDYLVYKVITFCNKLNAEHKEYITARHYDEELVYGVHSSRNASGGSRFKSGMDTSYPLWVFSVLIGECQYLNPLKLNGNYKYHLF
jgi:hypothetical protein